MADLAPSPKAKSNASVTLKGNLKNEILQPNIAPNNTNEAYSDG